mgnify:CR=1 FL=1
MSIHSFFSLLGGLALFLYGMQMMSTNLEAAAGSRMKQILERLTANRFLGVFVGAGITAIIQSSSATTVMVVGFVNSQLMTLKQAVWIIMGANIGTTVTGQLIALDIGAIAPLIAFASLSRKQPRYTICFSPELNISIGISTPFFRKSNGFSSVLIDDAAIRERIKHSIESRCKSRHAL